jgi:hypothetical protein
VILSTFPMKSSVFTTFYFPDPRLFVIASGIRPCDSGRLMSGRRGDSTNLYLDGHNLKKVGHA